MWWLFGGLMSGLKKLENAFTGIARNSVLNIWVFS
jgi:hypothetical protein